MTDPFYNNRQVPCLNVKFNTNLTSSRCKTLVSMLWKKRSRSTDLALVLLFCNLLNDHFLGCTKCKGKSGSAGWLVDSGASAHFTNDLSDFAEYEPYKSPYEINTAKKCSPL